MLEVRKIIMIRNVIVPLILENTLRNELLIISHKSVKKVEIDEKKRVSVKNDSDGNHPTNSGNKKRKVITPTIRTMT